MASDDSPFSSGNERATNERVQKTLTAMHRYRGEFQQARQLGPVDDGLHLAFQSRVLEAHDALRPYRGSVADQWREATEWEKGLSALPRAVAARPRQTVQSQGFGRTTVDVEYAPQLLAEEHLLSISYELDEIAREIGFEPEPATEPEDLDGGMI